jgi:hypothetical protein
VGIHLIETSWLILWKCDGSVIRSYGEVRLIIERLGSSL